jgi:hypothetical protein
MDWQLGRMLVLAAGVDPEMCRSSLRGTGKIEMQATQQP